MTISEPILASLIGVAAVILVALVSAWGHINSRLGRVEKGQDALSAEIRASRDRSDMQLAAVEERALARHAEALEKLAAVEDRALARHTEALGKLAAVEDRSLARHTEALGMLAAVEDRALTCHTEALGKLAAVEDRALARESAAEDRSLARHNELLAEIRLWRTHGHDADGNIFFRVPE